MKSYREGNELRHRDFALMVQLVCVAYTVEISGETFQ